MSTRAASRRYTSVQQDWRAFLPEAKSAFFYQHSGDLENAYLSFSVSLNEALDFHNRRLGVQAFDTISISSELCSILALRVNAVLHSIRQRGRHFGLLPNFAPLDSSNFQTDRGQRAARSVSLLSRILLSRHSQFLQKVVALEHLVDTLDDDFARAVDELSETDWTGGSAIWGNLCQCHFDLNTCLRETMVLFKSFLFVMPEAQLAGMDFTIRGLTRIRHSSRDSGSRGIRPRRMTAVAGK
jgi:hypothetical protein